MAAPLPCRLFSNKTGNDVASRNIIIRGTGGMYALRFVDINLAADDQKMSDELSSSILPQVPSEAFRLGRTRVFFRAGQISTVQKILNETTPDKAPWIFKRLQEALANRQKAKAAAQEAEVNNHRRHYVALYGYWSFVILVWINLVGATPPLRD